MTVHIDGIIFSLQRQGGISVYFRQLLDHLAREKLQSALTLENPTRQILPDYGKYAPLIQRTGRTLERYRSCRMEKGASLFHSSYYRLPSDRKVPSVVTVHDFIYERFGSGARRLIHMTQKHAAIRAAHAVICISESTRHDFLKWVGEKPGQLVRVIHNGAAEVFRPLQLEPVSRPYILYVGERRGYKNFQLALGALALLPDLELHCVGGGQLRSEELDSVGESTRVRVRHLGFVSDDVLNECYNGAVCLVYPSSYEGFGIPIVEAMRAGCPVVSIDCKAVLEIGRHALTVASDPDAQALAEAIRQTESAEHRKVKVKAGIELGQNFSWGQTHRQTLEVYAALGAYPSKNF